MFECLCVLLSCPVSCLVAKVSALCTTVWQRRCPLCTTVWQRINLPDNSQLTDAISLPTLLFLLSSANTFSFPTTCWSCVSGSQNWDDPRRIQQQIVTRPQVAKKVCTQSRNQHPFPGFDQRVCLFQSGFYSIISASGIVEEMQCQQSWKPQLKPTKRPTAELPANVAFLSLV